MCLLSAEAQRVTAREFVAYGHTSPATRLTHYLAQRQSYDGGLDGELEEAAPCQWEAMMSAYTHKGAR